MYLKRVSTEVDYSSSKSFPKLGLELMMVRMIIEFLFVDWAVSVNMGVELKLIFSSLLDYFDQNEFFQPASGAEEDITTEAVNRQKNYKKGYYSCPKCEFRTRFNTDRSAGRNYRNSRYARKSINCHYARNHLPFDQKDQEPEIDEKDGRQFYPCTFCPFKSFFKDIQSRNTTSGKRYHAANVLAAHYVRVHEKKVKRKIYMNPTMNKNSVSKRNTSNRDDRESESATVIEAINSDGLLTEPYSIIVVKEEIDLEETGLEEVAHHR
jgi:hypothetical protein